MGSRSALTLYFLLVCFALVVAFRPTFRPLALTSATNWPNKQMTTTAILSTRAINRQRVSASNEPSPSEDPKAVSAFDQVASNGLAGVLAIACAEAIFWALGVPLAAIYYKYTTGEWIDMTSTDGQLKAAGFSFGYGGFATLILQYRVTLFAIPLVPVMKNVVVNPLKKILGEKFGERDA
jgi:hypothetical protein